MPLSKSVGLCCDGSTSHCRHGKDLEAPRQTELKHNAFGLEYFAGDVFRLIQSRKAVTKSTKTRNEAESILCFLCLLCSSPSPKLDTIRVRVEQFFHANHVRSVST